MRFNELTPEGIDPSAKAAIKGMRELSGDQYYGLYKTMKDVAGHDGKKQTAPEGATDHEVSDKPFAYAYTDEEKNMIKGVDPKAKQLTSDKSEEVKEADMGAPLTPPTVQQWAAKVKSLYPDVQFIRQKMLNGVTFAFSKMAGGKVGFFDPARGINKTVPVGAPVLEADNDNVALSMAGQIPQTDLRTRPSIPSKRLEVGGVIGYIPRITGRPTGKMIKAEVLELGGMIGKSSVRVKLLDPQDIADNGGKLTAIISQFDVRQNPYVEEESVNEGVNHPALRGWDEMDQIQKRDALQAAGIVDSYATLNKTPSQLDDILHAARVKAQNQEDELNIGASGRRELQRQAKQDFEEQRQQLHKEKMEMERFAWEKANTEAERKHEMAKIDKEYTQELRKLQMSHMQDMEKILHADTHELNKMKAEFNMRQAEREQVKPRPQRPRQQAQSEPEDEQGNNFDQDTGKPINPSNPQTWHTSQQLGNNVKDKDDDVIDVEARPASKPPALNAPKREGKYDNNRTGFSRGARDDERHDLDVARPLIYGLKINGKIWQKDGNTVTFFTKERALAARNAILAKRPDVEVGLVQRPKD